MTDIRFKYRASTEIISGLKYLDEMMSNAESVKGGATDIQGATYSGSGVVTFSGAVGASYIKYTWQNNDFFKRSFSIVFDVTLNNVADATSRFIFGSFKVTGGTNRFYLFTNTGRLNQQIGFNAGATDVGAITNGRHTIIVTSYVTGGNISISTYLDGVLLNTTLNAKFDGIGLDYFLAANGSGVNNIDASFHKFEVYNRVLTRDEIYKRYNNKINDIRSNLVLDLPFRNAEHGQPSASYTRDISGKGNHAELGNAGAGIPTKLTYRRGYNFNNDRMIIASASSLDIANSLTLVCLAKINATGDGGYIDKTSLGTGTNAPYLLWTTGGTWYFSVTDNTGTAQARTATAQIGTHHVVGVLDPYYIYLYVNGDLKSSTSRTIVSTLKVTANPVVIGSESTGNLFPANADIYTVQIYNTGLTPAQVKQLYLEHMQLINKQ